MITGKNFIGSKQVSSGNKRLVSFNPANGETHQEGFVAATEQEVSEALALATSAFKPYREQSASKRAKFLRAIAQNIMDLDQELVERAMAETGLPEARIKGERGRTCNQLRSFADIIEEGSWLNARIDTAIPDRAPAPKPDLRKMEMAIGPVAVFGASNFPLAYSTAGGDTASALAAGNPVIVKGHESHLGTNDLVSQAILKAIDDCEMPNGTFSMVNGGISVGQQLVKDERIKAVGFTGSHRGGRALMDSAAQRKTPIPVYAEMGSTNPVLFLPDKLKQESSALAQQLASSVTLGVGQFCTSPGLLIGIKSNDLDRFKHDLAKALSASSKGIMLNENIGKTYVDNANKVQAIEAVDSNIKVSESGIAASASVSGSDFITNPELHHEVFGPFTIVIECRDKSELLSVVESIDGQLTGSFMATEQDMNDFPEIIDALRERVGRIICNGVPTGVEVCPAMHHGGPYPASSNGRYTSVGYDALIRFTRPIAFQSWPDEQLPSELKNSNPSKIWRLVNNEWTKDGIQ
jgi:alpha-ketoglutaric semialdehyde dehydrogenase